ncbi:hypothetical protein CVT24_013339, partial [Panaeolus cyanescens]
MAGKTREESKEARKRDREAGKSKSSANVAATTSTTAPPTANIVDIVHTGTSAMLDPELYAHAIEIPYEGFAAMITTDDTTDTLLSAADPVHHNDDPATPFIADSGASVHISPYRSDFDSITPLSPRSVKGIGGINLQALGTGNITLNTSPSASITLHNALYVPSAGIRLVSMKRLATELKIVSHFDDERC